MFEWISWDALVELYGTGFFWSFVFFFGMTLIFACLRWGICVHRYVRTGDIGEIDDTWFFIKDNWMYGTRTHYKYGTHPGAVTVDILFMFGASLGLAMLWPVTVITSIVVTYAKIARYRFIKKQTFIANLKGTEPEIYG